MHQIGHFRANAKLAVVCCDLRHLSHLSLFQPIVVYYSTWLQLRLVSISLLGFFISVVAVPLLRLTVGSSIGAWCGHFRGAPLASRVSGGQPVQQLFLEVKDQIHKEDYTIINHGFLMLLANLIQSWFDQTSDKFEPQESCGNGERDGGVRP